MQQFDRFEISCHVLDRQVAVGDSELGDEYITPSMFDSRVVPAVASAVADAAVRTGVARRKRG